MKGSKRSITAGTTHEKSRLSVMQGSQPRVLTGAERSDRFQTQARSRRAGSGTGAISCVNYGGDGKRKAALGGALGMRRYAWLARIRPPIKPKGKETRC